MSWFTWPWVIVIELLVGLRSGPLIRLLAANSATPIARNCKSGSRTARFSRPATRDASPVATSTCLGRDEPDRRRIGAFLDGLGQGWVGLDPRAQRIPGRPAAGRVLDHARVVERVLLGIEF